MGGTTANNKPGGHRIHREFEGGTGLDTWAASWVLL